jgi:hypothetical protein
MSIFSKYDEDVIQKVIKQVETSQNKNRFRLCVWIGGMCGKSKKARYVK